MSLRRDRKNRGEDMLRKIVIVCFAIAAVVGGAIAPTPASARGFRGGGFRGGGFRGGFGRGFGRGIGFGVLPYAVAPYYGYTGCYRTVRVFTPYGPRWRRVWVCG
jgi:hypothetical protein